MSGVDEVIAVENLCRSFGATRALAGVSFAVGGPQVIGLLGPNGAGKTTLLEILEGLQTADSGAVRLFGDSLDPARYPRRRVGVVLQKEASLEKMTVDDYAALFGAIYGSDPAAILAAAELEHRRAVHFLRLSGGEAQRLAIHAVATHGPDLLLLDEPTAHLDPQNRRRIGETLRTLAARTTVLISTHDLSEAESVCDQLIFLEAGQVRASGATRALIESVPPERRTGRGLEDAFFHYCGARIAAGGDRA